jgi:hypothetical protein
VQEVRSVGVNEMPKKKDWGSSDASPAVVPSTNVDLLTYKEQAIREAVKNLKPITTFAAIGAEIGFSRQHVSKLMQERFQGEAAAMWCIGRDWRVPRATAELWIRELYDA